eukprot:5949252-Karenia_brevis.AAC.1
MQRKQLTSHSHCQLNRKWRHNEKALAELVKAEQQEKQQANEERAEQQRGSDDWKSNIANGLQSSISNLSNALKTWEV